MKVALPEININQEQITEFLNTCYEKAIEGGIPGSKNVYDIAEEYRSKYGDIELAAKKFVAVQLTKCTTSGFVTSLGGLITLPVAVPANITSVIYVQLRMIATLAAMAGYNVRDDEVQTLCYLCLVNSSVSEALRNVGVQVGNKSLQALLKKLPAKVFQAINRKVGFRLITKAGEKSVITVAKMVPIAGGIIGGAVDFGGTKIVASRAYKTFILHSFE